MTDVEAADAEGSELSWDPDEGPRFVACFGRKGSGKSNLLRAYFASWPYDALLVDPTRDFDPDGRMSSPWPGGRRWPKPPEGKAVMKYRYVPNRRQPKDVWQDDLDAVVLAAHDNPAPTMILVDEARCGLKVNEVRPGMDVVLNEGRHNDDTLLVAGPRPIGVDSLAYSQADDLFLFQMPHAADVKRIAQTVGFDADDIAGLVHNLDEFGFVRLDQKHHRVFVYPPVPEFQWA